MATAPQPPTPVIVSSVSPPSGGDWALVAHVSPTTLPNDADPGIDQSTHQMSPYGQLPAIQAWIDSVEAQAAAQGKRVYYVGVWGSAQLREYVIIGVTDK